MERRLADEDCRSTRMPQRRGQYQLAGGLRRESFYPILQGYKDSAAVGMRLNLSDPLQLNRADVTAPFSPATDLPADERVHLDARLRALRLARARLARTRRLLRPVRADEAGAQGLRARVGRKTNLIFDEPRRLDSGHQRRVAGNLDRLPDYQNVPVTSIGSTPSTPGSSYTRRAQLARVVDDETGTKWAAQFEGQVADGAFVPKLLRHLRSRLGAAGWSFVRVVAHRGRLLADRSHDPFANFFFGGFGNNYVDVATRSGIGSTTRCRAPS